MNTHLKSNKLTLSAAFLAVGLILPFFTGQVPQIGNMLLPMHLPVFLCGLVCGRRYGLLVGFILPLLRSMVFGMPVLYPMAVAMAFELGAYGFVSGQVYFERGKYSIASVYVAMLTAMVAGRVIWAWAMLLLVGMDNFTLQMFLAGAVFNAIPGIILQLILIPAIMAGLQRAKGIEKL